MLGLPRSDLTISHPCPGTAKARHRQFLGFVSAKRLVVTYRDHPGLRGLKRRQRCGLAVPGVQVSDLVG